MKMQLKIDIEVTGAAMQDKHDVLEAMRDAFKRVENGETVGGIKCLNGNTVGGFTFKEMRSR